MCAKKVTKTQIARDLGVSRQSLYYKNKKEGRDQELKQQILDVLQSNPAYGYRRIALHLDINKKKAQRIMQKYNIRPYKREVRLRKRLDLRREPIPYQNLIKDSFPIKKGVIYAADFTYIPYKSKYYYLATFMDLYTREIVGWDISNKHDKFLVLKALLNAIYNTDFNLPKIIHSDRGSEYCSKEYLLFLSFFDIRVSMSKKSSPWENGCQESFYSNFKTDLGLEFDRFDTLGEFIEGIHQTIHYYNNERIHTSLKMAPSVFAKGNKSV